MSNVDDDAPLFIEEDEPAPAHAPVHERSWKVAIVDDDEDVHQTTRFALAGVRILNRPLEFIHTYSKAETHEKFPDLDEVAVVLLDVVMETEHAGLELVSFIRDTLRWQDTRIILRTGQPGYAPEEDAIRNYDINDYKTKNELTRKKLLTSLTAAIRSYEQIRTIEASRRGLHQIILASAAFTLEHGIRDFAAGVITQIAALCGVPPEGLICAQGEILDNKPSFSVIASAGHYQDLMNCPVEHIHDPSVRDALTTALTKGESLFGEDSMTLYFSGHGKRPMAAYIDLPYALSEINHQLLGVFCANLGVCLDNLNLVNQLKSHAYRDQLLQLPNRLRFIEQLDFSLHEALPEQRVVLLDIDDFAAINDAIGHQYGDLLLQAVALRLRTRLGDEVFLARISADVFGLLGTRTLLRPETLRQLFAHPFLIGGSEHSVSMSMGLVDLQDYVGTGADILKDASIALKRAKSQQRGSAVLFTREMGFEIRERAALMQHMHKAFDAERLFLMYQPQIDLGTDQIIGLEALIRWRGDDGLMIPPGDFIPLAEYSGLIISLGSWVLRRACFAMAELMTRKRAPLRMAVNVSAIQFRQDDFVASVASALADSGLPGPRLELEVTESVAMTGSTACAAKLAELKRLGVQIAIDDFGTGFSSLSYLGKLPVDRLKIDQSFVSQIDRPEGARIAELIIQLARKLEMAVIAEGIEHAQQKATLRALGCQEGQGFHIALPMPEEQLYLWLDEQAAALPAQC